MTVSLNFRPSLFHRCRWREFFQHGGCRRRRRVGRRHRWRQSGHGGPHRHRWRQRDSHQHACVHWRPAQVTCFESCANRQGVLNWESVKCFLSAIYLEWIFFFLWKYESVWKNGFWVRYIWNDFFFLEISSMNEKKNECDLLGMTFLSKYEC